MRIANVLAGFSLAEADVLRKAVGQEGRGADQEGARQVLRAGHGAGPPEEAGRRTGRADRDLRPVRLQQVALGRVLGPVVPDGLAQGPLPRRVHGGAAVVGNRQYRQGGAVHQRGARARARGAAAGRERVGLQVHRGRRPADPLRPGRHPERRLGRDRVDHRRTAGRAVHARWPTSSSGSTSGSATSGCSSRSSWPAPAMGWAATGSSSARRSTGCSARRSCCSRNRRPARRRSSARPAPRGRGREGLPDIPPWTEAERLVKEKEVLGFFISGHPLERFRDEVELFGTRTTATLGEWSEHQVDGRRGRHRGQAADLEEDRQGVRPAGARGLPRDRGGHRLSRRLGQAQRDHPAGRGPAAHRRLQRPRPGRGPRAVHRRVARGRWTQLKASGAVALSLRWRSPARARRRTPSGRPLRSARRTRARRPCILNGATGTGSRCGSGPVASASRRRRTSFGPCAISWAPIPSTTSRRDDPDGLSLYAGVREASARAGAADRGPEADRQRTTDRHRRRARRSARASWSRSARRSTEISRPSSGSWSPAIPAGHTPSTISAPSSPTSSNSTATASTWTIRRSWAAGPGSPACR